jgi:transcription initiation factor IIE alpha subunit
MTFYCKTCGEAMIPQHLVREAINLLKEIDPWVFDRTVYDEHGWEEYYCTFCYSRKEGNHNTDCRLRRLLDEVGE